MGDIFNVLFYEPLYNALVILYRLFGNNLGLAIIGIAFISRFVMIPLTIKQIKMAESSREMNDKVKELKKKYKNDKEKLQQEMLKIQSEYLPGQLAGCLPMIFQLIFFINLYRVIRNLIDQGADGFNKVAYSFVDKFPTDYQIDDTFVDGVLELKKSASNFGFGSTDIIPYIILILLVGASQYGSMKIMMAMRKEKKGENKEEKKKKEDKDVPEDFAEILQQSTRQSMMLMPILIMFLSYSLPAGLGLYWISQSGFVIIQQFIVGKIKKDQKDEGVVNVTTRANDTEKVQHAERSEEDAKRAQKRKEKKKNKKKRKRKTK